MGRVDQTKFPAPFRRQSTLVVSAETSRAKVTKDEPRASCGLTEKRLAQALQLRLNTDAMKLEYDSEALQRFCRERGVAKLELFGSALREEDFREDSDVDLLATVREDVKCGLFEWVEMKLELEKIFGRPVDLVSRWAIERSRNPYRKASILARTEPLYVEG